MNTSEIVGLCRVMMFFQEVLRRDSAVSSVSNGYQLTVELIVVGEQMTGKGKPAASVGDSSAMRSSTYSDRAVFWANGRKTGNSEPWYQQNPSDDEPGQLYEMATLRPCDKRSVLGFNK